MVHYSKAIEKKSGTGILYWEFGEKGRQPLLLLPGFTGTHKDLANLANMLKEKYRIIIPEFPGWENAVGEKSSYTISSYADFVEKLITDLSLGKTSIVAHCMGATVALETAFKYPEKVKQLILISTPYQGNTVGDIFFSRMATWSMKFPQKVRPLFFFWRSRLVTTPISFFVLQTRTLKRKLRIIGKTLTTQSNQNEHVLETNWNSLITYNYKKLKVLTIPVHILHGEKDLLILPLQAERLSEIIPNATVELIPNAGHLPPVETPETVAHMIEKYLSSFLGKEVFER